MTERKGNTIVVDLDGPVLDVRARHYQCYKTIVERLNVPPLSIKDYWSLKRTGATIAHILGEPGGAVVDAFVSQWAASIEEQNVLQLDEVQPLARETLHRWKQHGASIILATMRRGSAGTREQLRQLDLESLFDEIVICDAADGTPDAKANAVLDVAGKAPDLWIGDTELDARAARIIGCPVALLTCGLRSKEQLKRESPEQLVDLLADVRV